VDAFPVHSFKQDDSCAAAQQVYCVWQLRSRILSLEFLPYLVGSLATLPIGILLLL
jgi:hypothetical protein